MTSMEIFTVGHSNHAIAEFINLLEKHQITTLADVRSHPYSRYLPHFNRDKLRDAIKKVGIDYVFFGNYLGARSNNLNCYVNGKALYERIATTEEFIEGLARISQGAKQERIVMMCAEQDPITCHRAILVSRHLKNQDFAIKHILKDGSLETHEHLEQRLVDLHDLNRQQLNLFALQERLLPHDKALQKAYQIQGKQIAYVDKKNNLGIDENSN